MADTPLASLVRTPMYDEQGNMTRAWILYFEDLSRRTNTAGDDEGVSINGVPVTY